MGTTKPGQNTVVACCKRVIEITRKQCTKRKRGECLILESKEIPCAYSHHEITLLVAARTMGLFSIRWFRKSEIGQNCTCFKGHRGLKSQTNVISHVCLDFSTLFLSKHMQSWHSSDFQITPIHYDLPVVTPMHWHVRQHFGNSTIFLTLVSTIWGISVSTRVQ